jgi:probable F420-dependent oxidoreductase
MVPGTSVLPPSPSLKIGAVFPQYELGGDPNAVDKFGLEVEDMGFDHILAYDHVLGSPHDRVPPLHGPYTEKHPFHDPFVLFGYLSGLTKRIGFATGILILPQRQTALVARQAADVQILSRGRLRLGVGLGWNYVEYESLGMEFRTRAPRIVEQIGLLRSLWTDPLVEFQGRFDAIDRASINPRPETPIPVWMGGSSRGAYERAAASAEGFLFGGSRAQEAVHALEEVMSIVGRTRDPAGFGTELIARGPDPAEIVGEAETWGDAGGSHVSILTAGMGLNNVDEHLRVLREVSTSLQRNGRMMSGTAS